MAQQSFNFIFGLFKKLNKGAKVNLDSPLQYLLNIEKSIHAKCAASSHEDLLDLGVLEEALKASASNKIKKVMRKYDTKQVSKKDFVNS
jgi:hypothetical protein